MKKAKALDKENFEKRIFLCTFFEVCQTGKDIS